MSDIRIATPEDQILLDKEAKYCSYGDTVHYIEPPRIFSRCEGSYVWDMHTSHDAIRAAAQQAAREIGHLFSASIASGKITREALFDRRYQPIPDTDPPKHHTRFDRFTDEVLPAVQEALLVTMPQLAYCGAVDNNGYFPTHNKKFSPGSTANIKWAGTTTLPTPARLAARKKPTTAPAPMYCAGLKR